MDNDTTTTNRTAKTRSRKPRGFKIALLILLALFALFAAALYFLPHFLPVAAIRDFAKTKVRESANLDLNFGNLSFGWNGDVVIDAITVSPLGPDGNPGDPILVIDEARTNVALFPLLSGKAIVNSIEVNGFTATVRRNADGSLNLPDFSAAPATALADRQPRTAIPLSAVQVTDTPPALPPIEVHRLDLNQGNLSFVDDVQNTTLDATLDYLRLEGNNLDNPFVFSGRLLPYPGQPELGELPFTGQAALLKNMAFNPEGEATLEVDVRDFSLPEIAGKFGLGDVVRSARTSGIVRARYAGGAITLSVPELRLTAAEVGLGENSGLTIPDSAVSLNASFDPAPGSITFSELSLTNDIAAIRAQGNATDLEALAAGGLPAAALDFSGAVDFTRAGEFLSRQNLGVASLPDLGGKASFIGKAAIPPRPAGSDPESTVSVDFNDGNLQAVDQASGLALGMDLKGLGLRAAAVLASSPTLDASVNLAGVPGQALLAALGPDPVTFTLSGGAAMTVADDNALLELRLENTRARLPATPWSTAAAIDGAQTVLRFDMRQDTLTVDSLRATVNNGILAGVTGASLSGIMAGDPRGMAEMELSASLADIRQLLQPVYPATLLPRLDGTLRSMTSITLANSTVDARIRGEVDESRGIAIPARDAQAEFHTPKATLNLHAGVDLTSPGTLSVHSLEATSANTSVSYADTTGSSLAGGLGGVLLKAAGTLDASAAGAALSSLSLDVSGMNLVRGTGGQTVAGLSSGLMKISAVAGDGGQLLLPLSGQGDFAVPALDFGVDNLVFSFNNQESSFGNVRAQLGADGYIGPDKRQLVNLRKASLAAVPLALNSRGQFDIGSGALLAEYAARLAPAGLAALLNYLGLPPSLLGDAAVTGTVGFNGSHLQSKGAAQGSLTTAGGVSSPFEMAHDFTAAWNPADKSLAVEIRRLDGNLNTQAGTPVATIAAQPSKLLLSRAGSKGLLDIRVKGSAAPSRDLLLGLTGVLPNLAGAAGILNSAQADGIYNAWLQLHDKDASTLAVNIGGEWQGAALSLGGTPYLAEAEKLSANIVGDILYQDNRINFSRLLFRSESGMMQADGTASVTYVPDANQLPAGVDSIDANVTFVLADVTRLSRAFPVLPLADFSLSGRIDGVFQAAGNARDIQIAQAGLNFRQFSAIPAEGTEISIPNGSATLGGSLSLNLDHPLTDSPYSALSLVDFRNGTASLQGALIRGKAVNDMAAAFELQNGVLTLSRAGMSIGGGADGIIQASGRVDFMPSRPAVALRMALQHIPLVELNSEIKDYLIFQQGSLNIPAQPGQSFGVAFQGFGEDAILASLALENFTFATGPVSLDTGPVLNAELDRARVIMRQNQNADSSRRVSFSDITGSAVANGTGVISFPEQSPISLTGADTADFRAHGSVNANHTLAMRVMVAGKLEELIGFTIPNLIPNLSREQGEQGNRLMNQMNESAKAGKYGLDVTGSLEAPDISGIGSLAGVFIGDILKSELLGGVLNLGKDAPATVLNLGSQVLQGALNPADTLKNAPGNIIHAPENVLNRVGSMFGITNPSQQQQQGQQQGQQQQGQQQQGQQQQGQQQPPQNTNARDNSRESLLRGLLGGSRR